MYKAFRSVRRPFSRLILHWRGLGTIANQEDDHRNDEEDMDEAADGVGRDQPYEPQYEQDDKDGPQHQGLLAPPSWGGVEVVVYAAESL